MDVVWKGETSYEATRSRMVWNARVPNRRPAGIARPVSAEEVVTAVRLARDRGLRIATRSGGHNWIGASLRDGALLVDLSRLDAIAVDQGSATAAVGPAARGRAIAAALASHDVAFPVGHCSGVPAGGFLLAGGFGWNAGAWGPSCLGVRALDVVTADGELVRADATENADLYWAARGAGAGFFGIVTRFELALHPLPSIASAAALYPIAMLDEVAQWASNLAEALPPFVEMTLVVAADAVPVAGAEVPPSTDRRPIVAVLGVGFADSEDHAPGALAPIERAPFADRALAHELRPRVAFPDLFDLLDPFYPEAHRYAADVAMCEGDFAARLAPLREPIERAPSRRTSLLAVMPPAPPPGAPPPDAAFSMAGRTFLGCYSIWSDPADDAANEAWARAAIATAEPYATSYYVGESDLLAAPDRARRCFSAASWQRLREIRAQRDPEGRFVDFPGLD